MKKTNAMRILDELGIKYEVLEYEDDGEHALLHGAAEQTAQKLGIDSSCVYKTIVMKTDTKEIMVFCQRAGKEINLKKARQAAEVKSLAPVKPNELNALTGYIRGGCSPIGMKRQFSTFIDKSAMQKESVCISAGVRGEQLLLSPKDLVKATQALLCDLEL